MEKISVRIKQSCGHKFYQRRDKTIHIFFQRKDEAVINEFVKLDKKQRWSSCGHISWFSSSFEHCLFSSTAL